MRDDPLSLSRRARLERKWDHRKEAELNVSIPISASSDMRILLTGSCHVSLSMHPVRAALFFKHEDRGSSHRLFSQVETIQLSWDDS
jgi:hypothetical protein